MKLLYLLSLLLYTTTIGFSQEIPVPVNYSIIGKASGDLDKDGVEELVVAYNTSNHEEKINDGVPRELIIYKKTNGQWIVWQKSMQALYGSRDGGMMGDPFSGISVQKGVLHISQDGGSSWKWSRTDKYRYDGKAFKLIGFVSNYGKPCEYWEEIDFNLITGKVVVKKESEDCEKGGQEVYKRQKEIFFKKGFNINLQNRAAKEIKILSPKYGFEIYVAIKNE
ncbi:MAG: hypothetical protein GXC72_02860 [Chitinophagaceae bacterium]|nr:hypothetical protein [Chitinophagaceae bacterium]